MTDDIATPTSAPRTRRTVLKVVLSAQLVLAIITAVGVSVAYGHLNGNIASGEDILHPDGVEKVEVADSPKQPLNMLILGSDSRDGAGNDIDGLAGGGERSDTTILLHVSADRQTAYGVSLPRDAIIDRPDCTMKGGDVVPGEDAVMFNTAFSVGGAQCTVQTVESLTGVYIDHFLTLDFNGFKAMVDAVNGVEVCLPKAVDDDYHDIHFDAGTQVLDGQDALDYVRERYVLSVTGDIGRMKRQQAFIASMVNKVMSAGTLSQPTKVYDFLNAVTSSIKVDSQLDSVGKLFDLATEFRDTGLDSINFLTVPNEAYEPDPNRLQWTSEANKLWKRIINDEPLGRDFRSGAIGADDPVAPSSEPGGTDSPQTDSPETDSPDTIDDDQADARLAAGLCA